MNITRIALRRAGAATFATVLVVSGAAWATATGTAAPVAPLTPAEIAATSPLVKQANSPDGPGLGLDVAGAQRVAMLNAPSGLARTEYLIVPSKKGPCLLRTSPRQGTGTDSASRALVNLGSLSCGAGYGPTVSVTPYGTIGVAEPGASVAVSGAGGTRIAAHVEPNGVWFAPPGASEAVVADDGHEATVDLAPQP